jgi:hypothetical protein
MISLKSLIKNMREAQFTKPQKGRETPLDAKVQISGFGVMTRKQLQNSIKRYVAEVNKDVRKGDAKSAYATLYTRKVLQRFLETEIQHNGE